MNKKEMTAIYMGGLIQGIALVVFPAAGTIFTNPAGFAFSAGEYGSLFISQSALAISVSAFSSKLSTFFGAKGAFLFGILANLASMTLLTLSALFMYPNSFAYPFLILATSCLGIGFGATVPTLNTMASLLRPKSIDTVILVLNALLGAGTTLAPLLISLFASLGFWWGVPLFLIVSLIFLFLYSFPLGLPQGKISSISKVEPIPRRIWLFIVFSLLYGVVETLNGNWATIYMKTIQQAPIALQTWALTVFWAVVTIGRVFFAYYGQKLGEKRIYQFLPIFVAAAFIFIGMLSPNKPYASLIGFGIAGLGCSALLPLTISFGTSQLPTMTNSVAGIVIAFYLLGYGIAAFGTGMVLDLTPMSLNQIYLFGAWIAFILFALAFLGNRGSRQNSSVQSI